MNVDTDALRWLQQVADGTTVTEVSDTEGVTQSGVSRALARLEAQIGTPLLRRSGRTLRMTHAGAVFKPHLDALLHHLDDGIAAVSQLIDPDTGTVALAFQQSLGTWLVPDLARSFRAAHPGVRFQLTQVRDELNSAALDGGSRSRDRLPAPARRGRAHAAALARAIAPGPAARASARRPAAHRPRRRGRGTLHQPATSLRAAQAHR
jgi:DNA-binding transcriptional LysR family regulator